MPSKPFSSRATVGHYLQQYEYRQVISQRAALPKGATETSPRHRYTLRITGTWYAASYTRAKLVGGNNIKHTRFFHKGRTMHQVIQYSSVCLLATWRTRRSHTGCWRHCHKKSRKLCRLGSPRLLPHPPPPYIDVSILLFLYRTTCGSTPTQPLLVSSSRAVRPSQVDGKMHHKQR